MYSYFIAEIVNKEVNSSVIYMTDKAQYGLNEYWEIAGKYGDCEDYALAKRASLLERGWPLDRQALCFCDYDGQGHVVLWVNTEDKGGWILDNRYPSPVRPKDLPYSHWKMWVGKEWVNVSSWE